MTRLPRTARGAHRPRRRDHLHVRRQERGGARGRHDRLGAVRVRPAHLLAQLQVPPPPRPALLRRPVPQLPGAGGRRPRRARLHRAGARGDEGRAHERVAVARLRRDARHRPRRRAVHAARLLLQDLHPAESLLAALREGAAARRGAREAAQVAARARVADGVPPPSRGRPGHRGRRGRAERRGGRGRARRGCGLGRRGPGAGRPAARRGRRGLRARARRRGRAMRASRSSRTRPRSAPSTASCRCGRGTRSTRSAPGARSTPPARSSSRCSSPATTCRA